MHKHLIEITQYHELFGGQYTHFTPVRHFYTYYYIVIQRNTWIIMKMFDLHVLSVLRAFIPSQNKTLI